MKLTSVRVGGRCITYTCIKTTVEEVVEAADGIAEATKTQETSETTAELTAD
ncbi:hypothetical protein PFDG_05264 [Plasmodium falciparum Dd2]|uniref:Uncharacterized protein n=1 Tax=Plasmodium falciparum (isolate Dd2) TaxID=57267 RepID=A0A0L7MA62_PLAF4|nr:hypothetical protein PFDG_05264 [Plasmodium falciparum Dd2]